jgi:hypothetical protein
VATKGEQLSILYEEPTPRPFFPVNGAIGGPAPDGSSVVAHLYLEFATIPAREGHSLQEGGAVDLSKGTKISRGDISRYVQATLSMSPEAALRIGQWMMANGEKAIEHRKKNQP